MSRLVLLGPPGAGKGTQAARLAKSMSVPAVSTGDIFRRNVTEGTELGVAAKSYMDAGEYVPDSVTNTMVAERLREQDALDGFVLDGYPRTAEQVTELDRVLAGVGASLDRVVELTADFDEIVTRLTKRSTDQGRSDDTEGVVRHRLEVYAEQTAPLAAIYDDRGLLVRVNGMGDMDDVTVRLLDALGASGARGT